VQSAVMMTATDRTEPMRTLILRLLRADPFLKIVTNDGRERTIKPRVAAVQAASRLRHH
jgi:hypothetical protein